MGDAEHRIVLYPLITGKELYHKKNYILTRRLHFLYENQSTVFCLFYLLLLF